MHRILLLTFFTFLSEGLVFAQARQYRALRTSEAIKVDGVLDESIWQQSPEASQFVQNWPRYGQPETQKTKVRIVYDDIAVYVAAMMYESSADSILRQLTVRDNIGNSDYFAIYLDTYLDKINGYGFMVTAAGVQSDARYSSNGEDRAWNAVWESKVKINADSWVVEMKIPYSAIRFSNREEQVWGLNFRRQVRRNNESFFWNPVNPAVSGFLNQFGQLTGIEHIKSPLRLALLPYISSYANHYPHNTPDKRNATFNLNGGMDVKYGINESFTLDMTLVPDFGQVQSDNQVLNLSPFEVRFNENRQFFTEGTELFNKGGFFYSRRVGGTPLKYGDVEGQLQEGEEIVENPTTSRLVNASKISGRTKGGLGIGIFNAVSPNIYATVENEEGEQRKILTQPLSNYNILVFDQSLKNNSYVSLINTNVTRSGHTYDANVTGGLFKLANKKNTFALNGRTAVSQKFDPELNRPDRGYTLSLSGSKISGNLQYSLTQVIETDKYNPNDLGILYNNNEVSQIGRIAYNIYRPFWKLNNLYTSFSTAYSRLYRPDVFQNFWMNAGVYTTLKNFYEIGTHVNVEPVKTYDFYEPRVAGRYYTFPTNVQIGSDFYTDGRKKFALGLHGRYRTFNENNRQLYYVEISPRYRVNDKLSLQYNFNTRTVQDEMGSFGENVRNDSIFFGLRNVRAISSTLNSSYIFTEKMSLTLRARHYTSSALYRKYFALNTDGTLTEANFDQAKDVNFNTFNVDMVFSWWFAPGSEVSLVWKNAIASDGMEYTPNYLSNVNQTLQSPQNNSISIKVLYYLDVLNLKGKSQPKAPALITSI
ncbi:carbohydrate binding family 9 domain-containing protein [Rhodocytophaga rosea]|uniref:Carbohydrate binding family 9 domain-containing protein n=1 Tax=Rhodocytophaga rosea TaxID=2704465 RepID=A0A6C0GHI7_9BACT|nr:DUF5916 domain-containing protein [Rhodocytophaga rosea]QHT67173.1 carbohydrate binding family 9 domain-containing protein [Rhodocytophaga rosea]